MPPPATISILSGQGQAGVASRFRPSPFSVVVQDGEGFPVANSEVRFPKPHGIGSILSAMDCAGF